MYFTTFPVASTNIFPHSNSKYGGQLATEWNLRAREMVATYSAIQYEVGPSFVHCPDDFEVRIQQDDTGAQINQSTIEIMPGRGVINGHYIETLTPMLVDLLEANATLKAQQRAPLKGQLEVGFRIFYSTEPTMAGAMLVDNEYEMYEGIQVVVLPKGELITPLDSPTDRSKVTAHIRLAEITFLNGTITSVKNFDTEKCQYISAERLANIDMMLSEEYIKKSRLNPKRLYTFAGKGTDPATGQDTWCDSTDSLMVFDHNPQRTLTKPTFTEAQFVTTDKGKTALALPHKQIDGMKDAQGNAEYYAPKIIEMPVADYNSNSSGTVDKEYTGHIKSLADKMNMFHQIVKGKQVMYLETKDANTVLPPINASWEVGDYILVNEDFTADVTTDGVRAPSTMYAVLPGIIRSIKYLSKEDNADTLPAQLTGAQLGYIILDENKGDVAPSTTTDPATYPIFYSTEDNLRGVVGQDYFVATFMKKDGTYSKYYYVVETAEGRTYSKFLLLTGEIPLAQEEVIGGFYNVPSDAVDAGYVYRDEYGRLRLIDYALLRSGTLAYQLGEDITLPTGLTTEEVQVYLDEYVNQRIAFPNNTQMSESDHPNVINVTINLVKEDSPVTINIYDLDSRFNTSVYLHISGEADSNTTINIVDCEKIRIDNNIAGDPVINLYRSTLYYDPSVIDYIRGCQRSNSLFKGIEDFKLWYAKFDESDANLLVDNMTVSELDAPIIGQDIDFWNTTTLNDNHYKCALSSITFSSSGEIVRCGLLVANESTNNIEAGHKIITSTFELPQGAGLMYPKSSMTKQLKITGTFVSAYYSDEWIVTDTHFTALTSTYDEYDLTPTTTGSIAFHAETNILQADVGEVIPGWEPDTYHLFQGGALS